jgi:K+-transporting ATPase ATPase B chain
MILDKTGTITFGNRMASEFVPVEGVEKAKLVKWAAISSMKDETPEGRSVLELMRKQEHTLDASLAAGGTFIEFKAETRMSGLDLADGRKVRKGAVDSVRQWIVSQNGSVPADLEEKANQVASEGGTPLAVALDDQIYGIIYLKDTVKPGMKERFDQLREMGIRTIMCTGDNPLTAATIAREAGVDDFVAESKPEDKIAVIRREQEQGKLVAMTGDGTNDAPALAQADVGLAMNSGTVAAKEAANMVDLDSDPSKIIEVVAIGKQLLMTRGALTTFSIANDVAKYFAIIPAMFMLAIPQMGALNVMGLGSPLSAILSALIFNAVIIPLLIPLAMKGVKYKPMSSDRLLGRNLLIYGLGGMVVPFVGIKAIDLLVHLWI